MNSSHPFKISQDDNIQKVNKLDSVMSVQGMFFLQCYHEEAESFREETDG